MTFIEKYAKPFFFDSYHKDKLRPVKVFIVITFCCMITGFLIMFLNPDWLPVSFVLGLSGLFGLMIGSDVWRKNAKDACHVNSNINNGTLKHKDIQNDDLIGGN